MVKISNFFACGAFRHRRHSISITNYAKIASNFQFFSINSKFENMMQILCQKFNFFFDIGPSRNCKKLNFFGKKSHFFIPCPPPEKNPGATLVHSHFTMVNSWRLYRLNWTDWPPTAITHWDFHSVPALPCKAPLFFKKKIYRIHIVDV